VLNYLVETLEAGVKHIYAITGDSLDPDDAVRRDGRL
jgi:hypothetical protein